MNQKEVTGAAQETKGKAEKAAGNLTGDQETRAHGAAEEAKGNAKKQAGQLDDKVVDAKNKVKAKINEATR